MGPRTFTVRRFKGVERLLTGGRGIREIALALKVSRRTVREVRDGQRVSPDQPKRVADPQWMVHVNWALVLREQGLGRPVKDIWQEQAQVLTTYSNFWKQLHRRFPSGAHEERGGGPEGLALRFPR
jgi:hypothetical protein